MGYHNFMWLGIKIYMVKFFLKKKVYSCGSGLKIRRCHKKSKFQNYGTMVVDSLKHPFRKVEKENI